jgi:regulation of enolase protein 1 (concanavalin A-like superfamily)
MTGRLLLGLFLASAGLGHLTVLRQEFHAQVPPWFPIDANVVVVASGAVEVAFRCELSGQFDQAGAYVRFDDEHWIKAGVEHSDGVDMLGGVVTMGRSDWSTGPVPHWSGQVVTVRISRAEASVTVRARFDAAPYQLVRVAPTPPGAAAQAGPFLCAPTRAGLSIDFLGWRETEADAALHE